MITFQQLIGKLSSFWEKQGCLILQGYDLELGAGTFNPNTFLRCLGPEPYNTAYLEPCRRPTDGRYGTNPNRLQHYFQYQVIVKPSPLNIQDLYLESLKAVGFDLKEHDIRFVHDDWESPSLGAWGLGWEVWMDGMEITQYTYFQVVGGIDLKPITAEMTYGIERLAMYLQNVDSIFDIQWNEQMTYGDIFLRNEIEWSHYNFEKASTKMWLQHFEDFENEAQKILADGFPIPAYDFVIKASHAFNILEARGVISVTERTGYITRIRELAKQIAESYIASREKLKYPLLKQNEKYDLIQVSEKTEFLSKTYSDTELNETEDFLLEIGCEELPASFVPFGSASLEKNMRALLAKENIEFDTLHSYSTPRRLAILIKNLKKGRLSKLIEKKGPSLSHAYSKEGELQPAGKAFFQILGIEPPTRQALEHYQVEGAEIKIIKETPYLFGKIRQPGKPTELILTEQLPSLILNIEFPKKMRWAEGELSFARPLKWIVALFGSSVLPFRLGYLVSDRITYGHRFLSSGPISLKQAKDYVEELRNQSVIVDPQERENQIRHQIKQIEMENHVEVLAQEKLLPEVLNLVEFPQLATATFDPAFLHLPKEVITSEMIKHQRYFPVAKDNRLSNVFVITANLSPTKKIINGNQKVLSARLSDGAFLYEEDCKIRLETFNEKLKKMTFQKELGSVFQKVERLIKHTTYLQEALGISNPTDAQRAAFLCKADLASNMVYEFPDLQGIIGKYYALKQQEKKEVALAIEEHWMPKGENAPLPTTETGTLVSLADKFDTLIAAYLLDLKPTSSSDPYGVRRQVLGIIRILIQGKYHLSLKEVLSSCLNHFSITIKNREQLLTEMMDFFYNRVKTVFLDYDFYKDEIEASLSQGCDDIYDSFCRVQALHHFRKEFPQQFASLYEVYRRAKGQLEPLENPTVLPYLLREKAEKKLNQLLDAQYPVFENAMEKRRYDQAYPLLAEIQPALADLFDTVKILADDEKIKQNRLALLQKVFNLFEKILDFSKIQEFNKK